MTETLQWLRAHKLAVFVVVAVLLVVTGTMIALAGAVDHHHNWNTTLFTYRHGKLNVNIINLLVVSFVLAMAVNLARSD